MIPWWKISFQDDELKRVIKSFKNQNISQGSVTRQFEEDLEEYLSVENVIAVSSGSAALLVALMAIDIQPEDEVIIPDRTWIATAHAVKILGAKPIVCEVEKEVPLIKVSEIESHITSKTRAIIPVHLNGRDANINQNSNEFESSENGLISKLSMFSLCFL